jgi:hypothetical protein
MLVNPTEVRELATAGDRWGAQALGEIAVAARAAEALLREGRLAACTSGVLVASATCNFDAPTAV